MKLRITRYYVTSSRPITVGIGPFFSRRRAQRCARNCGPCASDPAMRAIGARAVVCTAAELRERRARRGPWPAEADLIAYARAHVTSPGAHALLDEVERGRKRRGDGSYG
jgi:hypothetical protein